MSTTLRITLAAHPADITAEADGAPLGWALRTYCMSILTWLVNSAGLTYVLDWVKERRNAAFDLARETHGNLASVLRDDDGAVETYLKLKARAQRLTYQLREAQHYLAEHQERCTDRIGFYEDCVTRFEAARALVSSQWASLSNRRILGELKTPTFTSIRRERRRREAELTAHYAKRDQAAGLRKMVAAKRVIGEAFDAPDYTPKAVERGEPFGINMTDDDETLSE